MKQTWRLSHNHLMQTKNLGFEQCAADACVRYVVHWLSVSIVAVVQVSDVLAVSGKIGVGSAAKT